jgi:hypothetical protein
MSVAYGDPPRAVVDEVLEAAAAAEDLDAIVQACRDYFAAWYTADAERMADCLHPDLAKRSVAREGNERPWALRSLGARAMIDATREGGGTKRAPEAERWMHITVRNVYGRIASATVVSYPYVEFLHLAKFDNRWKVVNTIWEWREGYLPPQA